jgi:hypothetical protein
LPAETVIDGEVVAVDDDGRPSVQLLQNRGSSRAPLLYFVFDVMVLGGRDVTREPLRGRRELLETKILPTLAEPVRSTGPLDAPLSTLIASVRREARGTRRETPRQSLSPVCVLGRLAEDARQPRQEFVIGGYNVDPFDALTFGYYEGDRLLYQTDVADRAVNRY